MATYTQQEADTLFDNGTTVTPGEGWIITEQWSAGYNEEDENGDTVLNFKGWHFVLIDANGNPVEFLLESTSEGADQATRHADAKARLMTIEK